MATKTRMTLAEFLTLPEEKPYAEFAHGEVWRKVSPSGLHQFVAKRIVALLEARTTHNRAVAVENIRVVFEDHDDPASYVPDISYYLDRARVSLGNQYVPPDLAIEIRSAGQSMPFLRSKCLHYLENDVQAAWIIHPEQHTVTVYTAGAAPVTFRRDEIVTFAGFSATVAELLDISPYIGS